MRLHAVAMIRNEADIVESFTRHHLRLLDGLTISMHSPTDGTREILEALSREGVPMQLVEVDDLGNYQGQRTTEAARIAFGRFNPDFVFVLDADEFIRVGSRSELEGALMALPAGVHGLLPWHTYIPTASDDRAQTDPLRRIRRRHGGISSRVRQFKVVVGRGFAADPGMVICHGNHGLASADPRRDQALKYRLLNKVHLAHYPVRDAEQILSKVLVGWLSHVVIGDTESRSGHWRDLYRQLRLRPELDVQTLTSLALRYAHDFDASALDATDELIEDPIPRLYELKYEHLRLTHALAHVVGFAERLASEYFALQQRSGPGRMQP